jgi:hypothetical protein
VVGITQIYPPLLQCFLTITSKKNKNNMFALGVLLSYNWALGMNEKAF